MNIFKKLKSLLFRKRIQVIKMKIDDAFTIPTFSFDYGKYKYFMFCVTSESASHRNGTIKPRLVKILKQNKYYVPWG